MLMDTNGNTKELLIKDLSSRLPYEVIVDYSYNSYDLHKGNYVKHAKHGSKCILTCSLLDVFISPRENEAGEYIKPYLFPLSSMTDAEKEEYCQLQQRVIYNSEGPANEDVTKYINWCYKKHLDINNLIPIGLAIDATGLNIY